MEMVNYKKLCEVELNYKLIVNLHKRLTVTENGLEVFHL